MLLTIVNVFSYMDRMALSVLVPSIKAELHLSDSQVGLLTGLAFSMFYASCGIPLARWADRSIRINIVALALSAWSVMTSVSGIAQNFWHLFAARMGVGVGEAGCGPAAQSMLCDYVPLRRRAEVFAIHNSGNVAGLMVGMIFAGWLGEILGWRWTFVVLGIPGIVLALIVKLTIREPIRGTFDARPDESVERKFSEVVAELWRCQTYRLLVAMYVLNGFVQYGLNQWWPSFYTRVGGLNLAWVGVHLGLALGVGAMAGSLIGGLLANKYASRDVRLPLIIGAVATLLATPFALASLFVASPVLSMTLTSLTVLLWTLSHGPIVATITSVVTPRTRATAISLALFAAAMLGFGLGPLCVGILSDWLRPVLGVEALRFALVLPVALSPLMAVVLFAAARALPRDLQRIGESDFSLAAAKKVRSNCDC